MKDGIAYLATALVLVLIYSCRATTRPCDQRAPEDLLTIGYTHLNFGAYLKTCLTFVLTFLTTVMQRSPFLIPQPLR
jgi:hypothetical protein